LAAEHLIGERHLLDWSVTSSGVTRDEPDRSDLAYTIASGQPSLWFGAPRSANRTFSALDESSWNLGGSYRLLLGPVSNPATVKVGGAWRSTTRDADSRSYDLINSTLSPAERNASPEDIFDGRYALAGRLFLQANANAGRYSADEKITAAFGQVEIPFARRFRLIGGARVERWNLDITTLDPFGTVTSVPAKRKTDILPAVALNVGLSETQTLRLSATETVSRPEYREVAPVQSFDFGGFLLTRGNANLRRARVKNLDARWEWYPRGGELVSVGVFGKFFDDPIERAIEPLSGQQRITFINADRARNYGVELELRKRLDFLGSAGSAFTLFSNTTLMHSEIKPGNVTTVSLTESKRPMVGQAPFVINAGLTWLSPEAAWSATVLYNVVGKRIIEAGATPLPDTYELERHVLDFSLQAPFFLGATVKVDGKNLLNTPYRQQQGDVMRLRYKAGRSLGLGFRWTL
jgi:TonB-dependent receptor